MDKRAVIRVAINVGFLVAAGCELSETVPPEPGSWLPVTNVPLPVISHGAVALGKGERHSLPGRLGQPPHRIRNPHRADRQDLRRPSRRVRHVWGRVHIVILDSAQLEDPRQVDFLDRVLGSNEDPTIVIFHHPRTAGNPMVIEYNHRPVTSTNDDVFLVLTGHKHNYQRSEVDGDSYVVTGGGGAIVTELVALRTAIPR